MRGKDSLRTLWRACWVVQPPNAKQEGTITTPFDMTVLNDLDRFHLVMDTIDRVPQAGEKGVYLKQQLKDKLIEHKQYIERHGEDMPEIRNWKWDALNHDKMA